MTEKKKGGRPRRAPGETLERITLNLRPGIRLGLEVLARQRKVSMSQACEYAIAVALRETEIGGRSALFISDEASLLLSEAGRTETFLVLPEELLTPEERSVKAVYEDVVDAAYAAGIKVEEFEQQFGVRIIERARANFQRGISHAFTVEGLISDCGIRPRQPQPPVLKIPRGDVSKARERSGRSK